MYSNLKKNFYPPKRLKSEVKIGLPNYQRKILQGDHFLRSLSREREKGGGRREGMDGVKGDERLGKEGERAGVEEWERCGRERNNLGKRKEREMSREMEMRGE